MSRGVLGIVCVAALTLATWAQSEHYPLISDADLPLYPALARALNLTGTVEIQLAIVKGIVMDAQVKSVVIDSHNGAPLTNEGEEKIGQYLSAPSLANIKNWRFESGESATFVVKYVYRITGKQTEMPENPDVDIDLPVVRITARPIKPTVLY